MLKKILFYIYIITFVVLAIEPYDRAVWFAENLPIVIIVLGIYFVDKKYNLSNLAFLLMFILPILHTIGGHYTFERVPFEFITNLFDFQRNNFDRIAHFSVGLFAYGITEVLVKNRFVSTKLLAGFFAIFSIFSVASCYEIIEWLYAISADSEAGIAVLGSQGDIWDAQKDMLSDGLGSIFGVILYFKISSKKTI
ncbi:MAG: DUF2238 domain-containing protein [Epsilonproteobacteria bacterium]|nr:DUF2238 domain-containing protein [Campylobacterota bacterium]